MSALHFMLSNIGIIKPPHIYGKALSPFYAAQDGFFGVLRNPMNAITQKLNPEELNPSEAQTHNRCHMDSPIHFWIYLSHSGISNTVVIVISANINIGTMWRDGTVFAPVRTTTFCSA